MLARNSQDRLAEGMDKLLLRAAILDKISAELENLTRAALMARDEATHEESKPENQYDMHAQEAAYLAEGQARLAAELNDTLALYQSLPFSPWNSGTPASIGSVVTLEATPRVVRFFIGPRSGGMELVVNGEGITVVTPSSPLGRRLVGAKTGDVVALPGRGAPVPHRVVSIE